MINWTQRDFTFTFDFLGQGKCRMISNAEKWASDYRMVMQDVTKKDEIKIHLAPGGGWVARVVPVK